MDREPLLDRPSPPEGLFWYLWMGRLFFRDSNWNAHFPSAAAKVAEVYRLGQGVQSDGVVTGSKNLMLDLVEAFGDIKVSGVEGVLTRDITRAYTNGELGYECLPGHASFPRGKRCFDEDVFFALRDRLTTGEVAPLLRGRLVRLIKDQLDRENILIHVFPPIDDSFLWE